MVANKRVPRFRPDLSLAESYIPGVFTMVKGMFYTCLCVLVQYGTHMHYSQVLTLRLLPILCIYYDHLVMDRFHSKALTWFIDNTSLSLDVLIGTLASQISHIDISCTSYLCCAIIIAWCFLGSVFMHIPENILSYNMGHPIVCICILCTVLVSEHYNMHHAIPNLNSTSMRIYEHGMHAHTDYVLPCLIRSFMYLSFSIVDAYTIRTPFQREKDRICMLKYGSILFSSMSVVWLTGCIIFLSMGYRLFNITPSAPKPNTQHDCEESPNINENKQQLKVHSNHLLHANFQLKTSSVPIPKRPSNVDANTTLPNTISGDTNLDTLDVNEAFRLAKLQYAEGKNR